MSTNIPGVVKNHRDTALILSTANAIPLNGEITIESDTGRHKIGDGVTAWNDLSYVDNIVNTFDISAGIQTMTLPKVTGYPQSYDFFWTGGDGTYKATTAVTNSETVGGLPAGDWEGEGEGSVSYVSNGTNWVVNAYSDYLTDGANQKIWKDKYGTEKQVIARPLTAENINTAAGALFITSALPAITRFHTFLSIDHEVDAVGNSDNNLAWAGQSTTSAITTATSGVYILDISSGTFTGDVIHESLGRWRT